MKGVAKTAELLVTDAERTTKLHDLLGSRFTNHGQLLLPTFRQYEDLHDDEGLTKLVKDMCRWLGYKPRTLECIFGKTDQHAYYVVTDTSIVIHEDFKEHPLVTGGIVACAVLRFVLQHHHFESNARFIEVATIETGLSLWMINAFQPKHNRRERFYHMLDGSWLQLEGLQLQAMSIGEYLRLFSIFTTANHLFPEDYGRAVSKRNIHLLPTTPSTQKIIPLTEPSATLAHRHEANGLWARILLLSLIAAAVVVFGFFIWGHRSHPISAEQTRDADAVRVIKASLDSCIKEASDKQSNYDPNDLFMTRQIDATKVRCESLRNQYNEALDHYEKNYTNF